MDKRKLVAEGATEIGYSFCAENPTDCLFQTNFYPKDSQGSSNGLEQHLLIFCQNGYVRVSSNLFQEEFLCAGEILFGPRGSDYHGVALADTTLLVHYFNNTVCRKEHCILSFLYSHKQLEPKEDRPYFYNKLPTCGQLSHLMDGVNGYLSDQTHEPVLWVLKHKELMWLLTKYYTVEELHLFFHPMTDEDVPFKSLVLAHYTKVDDTDCFASLCGYGLHSFRRVFKKEFGVSPYRWLMMRRAEHIQYRLSFSYIPFCDIIDEFKFSSPSHFCNFCKQFLGDTPVIYEKSY